MNNEQKDHSLPSASLAQNGMLSDAVQEGNIIIADFMGVPKCSRCPTECGAYNFNGIYLYPREMEYHSSWDWLMPVWKKLGNLMYEIRREVSGENYKRAEIITINVLKAFQKTEIDSAFNWIVEGVKWCNLNTAAVGSR